MLCVTAVGKVRGNLEKGLAVFGFSIETLSLILSLK
jgi:hypothetical protein